MIPCPICAGSSFDGNDRDGSLTERCPKCWGHGILFKGDMVRAILFGEKTETRRLNASWLKRKKGDRLWVRETWLNYGIDGRDEILYAADWLDAHTKIATRDGRQLGTKWRTPLHMPRVHSRVLLELTEDARSEPVEAIDEIGSVAEGFSSRAEFLDRFFTMHYGLQLYHPVVVLPFKRLHPKRDYARVEVA